jgi:chromosome segregation ATPase
VKPYIKRTRCIERLIKNLEKMHENLKTENNNLLEKCDRLTQVNESLCGIVSCSSSLKDLKNQNGALRKQVEDFTSTLAKFTQDRDNLDVLLGGQNKSLNKSGLGFNCVQKQKSNEHVNQSIMYSNFSICNFCNKKGYLSHKYRLKKISFLKI